MMDLSRKRLDLYLAETRKDFSRSFFQKFIRIHGVRIGGKLIKKPSYEVPEGVQIKLSKSLLQTFEASLLPEKTLHNPPPAIFSNKDFVVFDKPPGIRTEDVIDGFLPVHRLDKDTSGVLVAARTKRAQAQAQAQWQARKVSKTYIALVSGTVVPRKGSIEAGIIRSLQDRRKMVISNSPRARKAETHYEVIGCTSLNAEPACTLIKAFPRTGRTHQIRVHFKSIRHPIIGDALYGNPKVNKIFEQEYGLKRQFLHAASLELTSPTTKKKVTFLSKLPKDLADVQKKLGIR